MPRAHSPNTGSQRPAGEQLEPSARCTA